MVVHGTTAARSAATRSPALVEAARRPSRLKRWSKGGLTQLLSVLVFLVIWQLVGQNANPILFATPGAVGAAFIDMLRTGDLQAGFVLAAQDLIVGYVLAVGAGIVLGLFIGRNRLLEQILNPYINFMQATPLVALVPLIVIWFGIDFAARVAVVFTLAFWSVVINTATGVKTTPRLLIEVARIYHLSEAKIMRDIALPAAVPHIFAGLRIALGKALIGMIIAEMEISIVGLGSLLSDYGNSFKTAYLLAGIFTASIVGVLSAVGLEIALARFFPWVAATSADRD